MVKLALSVVAVVAMAVLGFVAVIGTVLLATVIIWLPILAAWYGHAALESLGVWSHPILIWLLVVALLLGLERSFTHRPP